MEPGHTDSQTLLLMEEMKTSQEEGRVFREELPGALTNSTGCRGALLLTSPEQG